MSTPTIPLEKEYRWYLAHYPELLEKYEGKVAVVKEEQLLGVYDNDFRALEETTKRHRMGTFLVHPVRKDEHRRKVVI